DGDELDFSAVAGASFLPLRRDPRNIGRSDAAMKSARAPSPDAVCERAGSNERDKTAAEKGCSGKRGHAATSDIVHEGDGSNERDETTAEKECSRKRGCVASPDIVHEDAGSNERDETTNEKVNSETHLDKKTIKVMTYNVWFREDLELTKRMYALGNLIQHHNPDLICFQEVTPNIYMLLQKSGWWQEYKCSLSARMAMQRQYYCMQDEQVAREFIRMHPIFQLSHGKGAVRGRHQHWRRDQVGVGHKPPGEPLRVESDVQQGTSNSGECIHEDIGQVPQRDILRRHELGRQRRRALPSLRRLARCLG
uniref:Endonuclease/exonuclease/phosphatase domain-containing protein n=1 Tax=Aegilops tauschii subsp. strangulata TaxID=200361 RepID=A0A453NFL9_AEGTS